MEGQGNQDYYQLIYELLASPKERAAEILNTRPELLDAQLVKLMRLSAVILERRGEREMAKWLKNLATILAAIMRGASPVAQTKKAEADKLFQQGIDQYYASKYREAWQSWQQALTLYREIGNRRGEAASLGNLGNAYDSLGQYTEAIQYHQQSLEIAREIGDRRGEAASLGNLGNAYDSLGRYTEAIEYHQQQLEIAREIGDRRGEAASLGGLGNAYDSLGQYTLAIEYHQQQSLEIEREIGDRRGEAASLGNLGNAYRKLQQIPEAIQKYQDALEIFTPTGFPVECVKLGRNLGDTHFQAQEWEQAISAYEKALEAVEQRCAWESSPTGKQKLREEAVDVYQNMIQACINTGNLRKALETVERSKSRNFVEDLSNVRLFPKDALPEICERLETLRRENSSLQRRLEATGNSATNSNPPNPNATEQTEQLRQQWLQNRQALDTLLAEIGKFDPTFELTQRVKPITFEEILALIDSDTGIVEWYISAERFYAFTVTTAEPFITLWQSEPEDLNALTQLRDKYLAAYRDENTQWQTALNPFLDELARILHLREILEPIRHCQKLVLIPYRELHLFPLHALPIEGEKCPLDIFPGGVRYAPSCQLWQIARINSAQTPPETEPNLFAIQNPTGDLPFANIEVEAIRAYMQPAHIFPQESASKYALKQDPTATFFRQARHIHFACHGTFDFATPMLSSIILAGAVLPEDSNSDAPETPEYPPAHFPAPSESSERCRYLPWRKGVRIDLYKCYTLGEIFALNLRPCRLVALSACETGLTALDSPLMGLPAGFLYAGAVSVVCSLWRVSDLSTALLMVKFYEMRESEPSVAKAMNRAQIWLRDVTVGDLREWIKQLKVADSYKQEWLKQLKLFKPDKKRFASPCYWAAFCAIGQ
ncbi:CHAT domain-containing protein [Kamptonema formosum]|uniref:CHAT domain-containing protein n=1 Tax=Kamptonema formosum TaxID=331992 RepID=UPI00034D4EA4|nr:CHAT domain-containing tetratricopeptide repeat protein [Oscillatoria sp. PCC 10802]